MSTPRANAPDYQPIYGSRADFSRRPATSHADQPGTFRCNICNQPYNSNDALMAHYRSAHPQEYARLETLKAQFARTNKPDSGAGSRA